LEPDLLQPNAIFLWTLGFKINIIHPYGKKICEMQFDYDIYL
jgi:hypothetical protein